MTFSFGGRFHFSGEVKRMDTSLEANMVQPSVQSRERDESRIQGNVIRNLFHGYFLENFENFLNFSKISNKFS